MDLVNSNKERYKYLDMALSNTHFIEKLEYDLTKSERFFDAIREISLWHVSGKGYDIFLTLVTT